MLRQKTFLIGLILSIILSMFYIVYSYKKINFFEYFELKTYDARYKLRGERIKEFDVCIIGIDEKSLLTIGKWPWKRDVHAKLIEKLNSMGAKSIGFDVSFTEEAISQELYNYRENLKQVIYDNYKLGNITKELTVQLLTDVNSLKLDEDYVFADEIRKAKNIVIGTYNIKNKTDIESIKHLNFTNLYAKNRYYNILGVLEKHMEYEKFGIESFKPEKVYKIMPPIDIITESSFGTAPYEIGEPYIDGVCRGLPIATYEEYTDFYFPPLYILVFLSANNLNIKDNVVLDIKKSKLKIYSDYNKKKLAYEVPIDKNAHQLLNFYGKHNNFEYISYIDILNDNVKSEKIKDKIIMVGYTDTAKGLYDLRATPFDSNTPGVELHATAIQNLIDKNHIKRLETWQNLLLMIISYAFIVYLLSSKRINLFLENIIVIIYIVLYTMFVYFLFNIKGMWIDIFYPLTSYSFMFFILLFTNYITEGIEKRKIKNAFEHYTSKELIEEVLENPEMLKLGGERKKVTAFFTDIADFTTMSESMKPEDLIEVLNEYLTIMTKIVIKQNGYIDKYIGDSIMASFGTFGYLENHEEYACNAAILYQEELKKMRKKWKKEDKPEIFARIGINTGIVVAGNLGSDERFDYTIIGDEVNLASRLEGANKQYGTDIMISESTYEIVKDKYTVRELDSLQVKGKTKAIKVYELINHKEKTDAKTKEIISKHEIAIRLYKLKEWELAIKEFNDILKIDENDYVSKLYIERCIYFSENDPGEDWDGVYKMKTK